MKPSQRFHDLEAAILSEQLTAAEIQELLEANPDFAVWYRARVDGRQLRDGEKLLPCRFCGDPLVEMESIEDGVGHLLEAYVCCDQCGARGPKGETTDLAELYWNSRPSVTRPKRGQP